MCSHYDETFTHNGKHIEYKEWEPIYNMAAKKRIKFIKKWQVQNPRSKNVCNSENAKSTTWVGLRRSRPGWNMEPNHSWPRTVEPPRVQVKLCLSLITDPKEQKTFQKLFGNKSQLLWQQKLTYTDVRLFNVFIYLI